MREDTYEEMNIKVGQTFWSVADDFPSYHDKAGNKIMCWTWVVTKVTAKQFRAKIVGRDHEVRFWRRNLAEVSSDVWHKTHLYLFE